jgi:hypothetical protein
MNDLVIEASEKTPKIEFKTNGKLLIEGNSLPEDSKSFYEPVISWVGKNIKSDHEISMDIKLSFLNTSSSKQIYELINYLANRIDSEKISINWFYEEDDEDILEAGHHYQSLINSVNFNFKEYF